MEFNERVKKLREEKGWTQIDLAKKAGISLASVRNLEQGAQVSNEMKGEVAEALGISRAEVSQDLNVAEWTGKAQVSADEVEFNKKLNAFFDELMAKLSTLERPLLANMDNWLGFTEVLALAKKHGVKLPKGIL